ncbi:MAG TPA: hypothetical protein VE081_11115 [Sporichthyaceae bacterium]|nr:hypothetical protein [Sporichthyaceae bacterium]
MSPRPRNAALVLLGGLALVTLAPNGPVSLPAALGDAVHSSHPARLEAAAAKLPDAAAAPAAARAFSAPLTSDTPVVRVLPPARPGPECNRGQRPAKRARYQGGSVSRLYDEVFHPGPVMPYLSTYSPQGLATWWNWDGQGHALILLGEYHLGHKSYLAGIDPLTGKHVGTVKIAPSHLGAMGVVGNWLITQDTAGHYKQAKVRNYPLSRLRRLMMEAKHGAMPYMRADGRPQPIHSTGFMFVEPNGSVWAGRHSIFRPTRMYRYTVDQASGRLHQVEGPWKVPPRTQGLLVTQDHFVFISSNSHYRGQMNIVRRADPKQWKAPVACLWTPSLPENMTLYRGHILTAFESGSGRFNNRRTHNRISHLHTGLLDRLIQIADPTALHPLMLPGRPDVLLPERDDDPNPDDLFLGELTDRTLPLLPLLGQTPGPSGTPEVSTESTTATPSQTPTASATPSETPSATATPSETPSATATATDTPSETPRDSADRFSSHAHDGPITPYTPSATPSETPADTPSTAPEEHISDAKLSYQQETGRTPS